MGENGGMGKNSAQVVTAALLVIGDEILSGRTKDKNIGEVAEFCTELGIELTEVRVVSDDMDAIVNAINALRSAYTYVFTTGGIGPTHDDITAPAVAQAFGVELPINEEARKILEDRYGTVDVSPERLLMARVPLGGTLIDNPVSGAPGFIMGNVHVMAGVPKIMQAMLGSLATKLVGGVKLSSVSIDCGVGESTISAGLGEIQARFLDVKIGSYPQMGMQPVFTQLVLRAADKDQLQAAAAQVQKLVDQFHLERNVTLDEDDSK